MSWFKKPEGSTNNNQGVSEAEPHPLGAESMISTQTAMELAASRPEASKQSTPQPTQQVRGKPHYR